MDSNVLHLRLDKEECEMLDKLGGKAVTRQSVARQLLIAAIEAVQRNQGSLRMPPQFTVIDNAPFPESRGYHINEPKTKPGK